MINLPHNPNENKRSQSNPKITKPEPYPTISLSELLSGSSEIPWLLPGIIPFGTSGILAGDSGAGKTWLTNSLGIAIATGKKWLGHFDVTKGSVLIVDEENAEVLLRNLLSLLLKGLEIYDTDLQIQFLISEGINFSQLAGRNGTRIGSSSFHKLAATIEKLEPSLVIFDSFIRVHSANENSSKEISAVFEQIHKLTKYFGATMLFTHHIRKGGGGRQGKSGERIRGSSDIRAFADYTIFVEKTDDVIVVEHDKSRWAEPIHSFRVKIISTPDTLTMVYDGTFKKLNNRDIWDWLVGILIDGEKDRSTLVRMALEQNICKKRKLDATLKWRTDNGYLEKRKFGKSVIYSLSDEAREKIESPIDLDELARALQPNKAGND